MGRGTRVGGRQTWAYHGRWDERKIGRDRKGRGIWKFNFRATKNQRRKGHFPRGGKLVWQINARQYVIKSRKRPNTYETRLVGTKRLVRVNVPKRR